jgi:hypothetical protein
VSESEGQVESLPSRGGVISSNQTPQLFKTCKSLRRTKIWSLVSTGSETKNDCAGEGQKQFIGLNWKRVVASGWPDAARSQWSGVAAMRSNETVCRRSGREQGN